MWRYVNPDPNPIEDAELEKKAARPILLAALLFLILFGVGFGLLFVALNSTFTQDFILRRILMVLILLLAAGALWLVAMHLQRAEASRYAVLQDNKGQLYALDYLGSRLCGYAVTQGVNKTLIPAETGDHLLSLAPTEAAIEAWVHALDEYGIPQALAQKERFGDIPRQITAVQSIRPALLGGHTIRCSVLTAKGRTASLTLFLPDDYEGQEELLPLLEELKNQQTSNI